MDKKLRHEILTEAVCIGDELLSIAVKDEKGLSWKLMGVDKDNKVRWHKSADIYSGVPGIVLFFLELYKQSEKADFLNAAVEGMRWVEYHCRDNPSDFYAFFSGRMGVSYTMVKMYDVVKDDRYLDKALMIAQPCAAFLKDSRVVGNLFNGAAGTILGLLHLHALTQEKWILEKINLFVRYLLESCHLGTRGLYWDRSHKNINGLCGFSHGASGIGFVFLELGHYFKNDAFYVIAELAFLYESYFYDDRKKNWPDLRKVFQKNEDFKNHEKALREGDLEFFTRGRDVNTWLSGAAGIGLARLRAFELLKKPLYEKELEIAVEKTIQTDIEEKARHPLFILGRGSGGNAELFLESYKMSGLPKYLELSEEIALRALAYKKEHNDYLSGSRYTGKEGNTSLFMSSPGIGYFYLKLLDPLNVSSIQMPKLDAAVGDNEVYSQYPYLVVSAGDIKKIVLKRYFRRSITVLESLRPQKVKEYFAAKETDKDIPLKETFVKYMERAITSLNSVEHKLISDIFALELEKMRMDEKIKSHILSYIKERVHAQLVENLREMAGEHFVNLNLVLKEGAKIKTTAWNWNLDLDEDTWNKNLRLEPGKYPVLLKSTPLGIREIALSVFTYAILTEFHEGRQSREVIPSILDSFGDLSAMQEKVIKEKIIRQVKEACLSGILVENTPG